jgi:hypothetical protein
MLDLVYKILSEDSALNAAVSGRIYPYIREEKTDSPAIMFEALGTNFLNTMSSTSKADTHEVRVTVVSQRVLEAATLGNTVRSLLDGITGSYTIDGGSTYHVASCRLTGMDTDSAAGGRIFTNELDFTFDLIVDSDMIAQSSINLPKGDFDGYEFTGGFEDRTTGQSGANDLGSNVQYTSQMASDEVWYRFGFSEARQLTNDVAYFPIDSSKPFDQTKGLFGGQHMPSGVTNLIDFSDTSLSAENTTSDPKYTAATGSYDLKELEVGDLVRVRFSFNVVPQIANSTLEVGLIFATRDEDDNVTFTFPLTTQPIYFGTGTQGQAYLNRVEMSAYIASGEDLNARLLPAVRCNNEILIQPLSTLIITDR